MDVGALRCLERVGERCEHGMAAESGHQSTLSSQQPDA
jgi:hypothetical protein